MPQLLTNKVIEGLRDQRNSLVTEYKEKLETFKPSYPAMVQINNKIEEIDRQIAHQIQAIKDSLKASYEASKSSRRGNEEADRRPCEPRCSIFRSAASSTTS